ncbi:copper amine oxidase N-terminal domain-containing protein [Cohnella cellulosilytica]|uniref:Copper amine oxidase N-terminal domain-containing protein n=1 Tax=Cohnella cellulosilytica TaxID=986710 RepID=A0ABW2F6T0_9BACL
MRKFLRILLAAALVVGVTAAAGANARQADAAGSSPKIVEIIGKDTMLMDDGTLWTSVYGFEKLRFSTDLATISERGLGITKGGRLMEYYNDHEPLLTPDASNIKQIAGGYWLRSDGTVWENYEQLKGIDRVLQIAYGKGGSEGLARTSFAMLQQNGDLLLKDHYAQGKNLKLGTIANPTAVTAMTAMDGKVAVLFNSGEVVVYEASNFDDNGTILPVTVAQNVKHIAYTPGNPTQVLLVTLKDGTVWQTGEYQGRWKLDHQVAGLISIARTVHYVDAKQFYAQREDGSWVLYDNGEIVPLEGPKAEAVDVSLSELKPLVGDTLKLGIRETYSNGAKIKVEPSKSNVAVDKPYLLKLTADGQLQVLGVGQAQVTVTTGGFEKTMTVSSSLPNNLTYAKLVSGTVFVPAKAVVKALGGTVSAANGTMEAKIGDIVFSFKAGDKKARLNGTTITLKAAPFSEKGETYIPDSLLKAAVDAKVKWDAKWRSAEISLGADAKLTVVSVETAGLVKKAMQGSLASFIGKSYWVNYFEGWDRFSKVTVVDVVPQPSGDFVVQFRNAAGKTLKGYPMSSEFVKELFTNEDYFFNFDPKKKYKWSAATWNQIKAGNVTLGMNKDQVKMAWGRPAGTSITNASGKKVETWVYYNFDTVAFVDGKVILIIN